MLNSYCPQRSLFWNNGTQNAFIDLSELSIQQSCVIAAALAGRKVFFIASWQSCKTELTCYRLIWFIFSFLSDKLIKLLSFDSNQQRDEETPAESEGRKREREENLCQNVCMNMKSRPLINSLRKAINTWSWSSL